MTPLQRGFVVGLWISAPVWLFAYVVLIWVVMR